MGILSTEQLGHVFSDNWLFKDIFLGLERGNRVALVGVNGTGKSTLLRILSGKLAPSQGKVVMERDLRIGYLEQDPQFDQAQSIADFIYSIDNKQQQLIREYEEAINDHAADEKRLNFLMDELSSQNAWEYEFQIKSILGRLGITHLNQSIKTLSGGQRKRLSLAKLLIDDPDVYILDEPTNHLDIETIEWLENFLSSGQKTVMLVTHDRYFLDHVCNQILELDRGKLLSYQGNYSYYLEKKAELEAADKAAFEKNSNLLRRELEWMRRQPKARTTKSKSRIDAFYDLEEKTKLRPSSGKLELQMSTSRQGKSILELNHLHKAFGDRVVLFDFSYTFKKGDRIGVAGKNGTGKSTLLNLITGSIQPDSGQIKLGETTVFGYYRQGGLSFNEGDRVLDVVKDVAEFIPMADGKMLSASDLLNHFLFPPAKQYTPVSKLSGGEKKRLQLLRVLMANPNFLILDEPTNDLDIDTLNVLEDFLQNFSGVLLLVSHDRYLVDRLTESLFVFEGDAGMRIYPGNYTAYRLEQEEIAAAQRLEKKRNISAAEPEKKAAKKWGFKEENELIAVELEMQQLESQLEKLTRQLNADSIVYDQLQNISNQIEQLNLQLEAKTARWFKLSELKSCNYQI